MIYSGKKPEKGIQSSTETKFVLMFMVKNKEENLSTFHAFHLAFPLSE